MKLYDWDGTAIPTPFGPNANFDQAFDMIFCGICTLDDLPLEISQTMDIK